MDNNSFTQRNEEQTIDVSTDGIHFTEMTPKEFIAAFMKRLDLSTLPPDDHLCPCCYVKYGTPSSDNSNSIEQPVRTDCGHIFGEHCLASWLRNNTCPLCRAPFFDESQNPPTHGQEQPGFEFFEDPVEETQEQHSSADRQAQDHEQTSSINQPAFETWRPGIADPSLRTTPRISDRIHWEL